MQFSQFFLSDFLFKPSKSPHSHQTTSFSKKTIVENRHMLPPLYLHILDECPPGKTKLSF